MSGCSAARRSWCNSSSSTPACRSLASSWASSRRRLIGLGVNEGAYLAEIIRAGISAVPRGQFEAARAIGMTRATTMRVVVMPQALRIIIPPLGNAFNGLMKTSSLASVISMEELLRRTELLIQVQFKVLEIFIVAALVLPGAHHAVGLCAAAPGSAFLALGHRVGPHARAQPGNW